MNEAGPAENSIDVVIDCVGADATRRAASAAIRPGGVIVHIGLAQGAEVAEGHGQCRDDSEKKAKRAGIWKQCNEARQCDGRSDLRHDRQEGGCGGRSTLGHVWNPRMCWHSPDLEQQADEHQHHTPKREGVGQMHLRQALIGRGAGHPHHDGHADHHQSVGKGRNTYN